MASVYLTTIIGIVCFFGKFLSIYGAPTYTESEYGTVLRNVLLAAHKATNRQILPNKQRPVMTNSELEPQHQTKGGSNQIIKPSLKSISLLSSMLEEKNKLKKMPPNIMPMPPNIMSSPPLSSPDLPGPLLPSMHAFPKPLSDVSISVITALPSTSRTFSFAVPPMFNTMSLLSRLAINFQSEEPTNRVPVTLKEATGTCQEIDQLGPLTSHNDAITIEIIDTENRVLWDSECLPDDTLYILPGYKVKFYSASDDNTDPSYSFSS
ncbi:uncharacterized protein [Antedon mediterranea]|uniref:uncharacterized protein n=1 Tax=Antedon mediterranea TaxID=105859 RepID=UPI003AF7FC9D